MQRWTNVKNMTSTPTFVVHLPVVAILFELTVDCFLRKSTAWDFVVRFAVRRPTMDKLAVRVSRARVRAKHPVEIGKLLGQSGDDGHLARTETNNRSNQISREK
jgi:hypothetical protein